MVDFHIHILPNIDDGAEDASVSIAMLRECARQGIDRVYATPHFYPDEEDPASFLRRREESCAELKRALQDYAASGGSMNGFPQIHLGAEVYYFPGISDCEEIVPLAMGDTGTILIEPPVAAFTDSMLGEIEDIYDKLGLIPVIAHPDRYVRLLDDDSLFGRLAEKRILVQVNASFFIRQDRRPLAMQMLDEGKIHFIGSDAHDTSSRAPNLAAAAEEIKTANLSKKLANIMQIFYNTD